MLTDGVSDSFFIKSETLCQFLDKAEERHQEAKLKRKVMRFLPGAKKKRRENTPSEAINSEDERVFADDEQRVLARASEDDSSYYGSSD